MTDYKKYRSLAIMGGTFDPVHCGHLAVAEAARCAYNIDRVLFIPTGRPPHKAGIPISDERHRLKMTELAIATNPFFEISSMEIDRPGPSYTVDTVARLRGACGSAAELYFITGADEAKQLLTWKDAGRLFGLCRFIAVTRPGFEKNKLFRQLSDMQKHSGLRLHLLETPELAISSTDIRDRVSKVLPVKYLVPEAVERYIAEHRLYAGRYDVAAVDAMLRLALSPKRYAHTRGVAAEAARLAAVFGADAQDAYMCGMLHDCAKEYSGAEKLKLCESFGIEPDAVVKLQPDLAHGYIAARIAERDFGVTSADMLTAIHHHPTGRRGMSTLEKILTVADMTEPNRNYESVGELRDIAERDLDRAVIMSIETKLRFTEENGNTIHPLSLEALEDLKKHRRESF